jgi:hypothetical protein
MTNRSVSWIEPEKLARLLGQVSGTGPARRKGPAPVSNGRATSSPIPGVREPVVTAVVAAPEAPKRKEVPVLVQTSDNPSDRLDTLIAWTLDHQKCTGAFIADDNGLTLAAHGISEAHVSLVGPLLSSLVGVRVIPGIDGTAGALWLGANMMSWVETRGARGGFCLGTVGPDPLSTQALEQLKQALEATVSGL